MNIIKLYKQNVLKPLDRFWASHYKDYLYNKNKKTLDKAYEIYLQKLDNFCKLVDDQKDKK